MFSTKTVTRVAAVWIATAMVAATMLTAQPASADPGAPRLSVDWGKLAEVLRNGLDVFAPPRETFTTASSPGSSSASHERLFGAAPHLTLVARDWGASQLLIGETSVTDQLRLSRSIRMVVTRVRLSDGIVRPFAQVGLGQWRLDTDLLPALPRDTELASQLGGGVEVSLAPMWRIAIEADYTILYREQYEPQQITGPHLFGAFVASRARF